VTAAYERLQRVDRDPLVEAAGQSVGVVHHRGEVLHRDEHDRPEVHPAIAGTLSGRQVNAAVRGNPRSLERRVTPFEHADAGLMPDAVLSWRVLNRPVRRTSASIWKWGPRAASCSEEVSS
jgi:hypothetical protein